MKFSEEPSPTKPRRVKKSKAQQAEEKEQQNIIKAQEREQEKIRKRKAQLKKQKDMEDRYKTKKIKPPLGEELCSFSATAVVISYFGFEDEVRELLVSLNQNAYGYFIMHRR